MSSSLSSRRLRLLVGAGIVSLSIQTGAFAQVDEDEALPATDMPGEFEGTDNEIIVTATKREQTLQSVPVAVSVTTAETIERAQIRDIRDLASVVPSLRVTDRQSSQNATFFIRGFGNGANNLGIEPSVGTFIDGVYRSRSASSIADLPDVQRVEVLRGPQSTLFGKNASAGVVSVITREPEFDFGGNVEASYGNYDAVIVKGRVTGPISDSLAVSLAGGFNKRDGYYQDLGTGNRTNERDRWFVRGQALFEPNDQLKVRIIADYGKIDENCCGVVNLVAGPATLALLSPLIGGQVNSPSAPFAGIVYNNLDSTNNIENYGISGQVDWRFGPATLTSITSYRRTNSITNQDSDFTSADLLGMNFQDAKIDTFTQELRLNANFLDKLNILLGAFYFNETIDQANEIQWGAQARDFASILASQLNTSLPTLEGLFGQLQSNPLLYTGDNRFFLPGQGLSERYRLKNQAITIFGQVDFSITDRLTLTGGLSYTHDAKDFSANIQSTDVFAGINIPALVAVGAGLNLLTPLQQAQLLALTSYQYFPPFRDLPNAVEPGRTRDNSVSYTARLAYDATDQINLYASVASGFKASSINLTRDSRPTAADRLALIDQGIGVTNLSSGSRFAGPEKSTVYELGLKANWGLATANVAIFKQDIRGFQSNIFLGTGFFLANAGKQSVFGIEFEGTVKPARGLTLGLAMTYLNPKYDEFPQSAFGDATGFTPADIPAISATLSLDYEHRLANDDRIIFHADFHYESPTQLVEGLPAFLLRDPITRLVDPASIPGALAAALPFKREVEDLNLSLTYAMSNGLELTAWGRNILDDRYLSLIFDSPAQTGSISGYPNQPRTYGLSARFRW